MNIGQLAIQAGVAVDTVRYYEREGLLRTARRSPGAYRIFDADDVARLRFIRRSKALGFTLEEITELLAISDQRQDMAAIKAAASAKLEDIERRIAELQRMPQALRGLVQACPGHGALAQCPIVETLNEDGR